MDFTAYFRVIVTNVAFHWLLAPFWLKNSIKLQDNVQHLWSYCCLSAYICSNSCDVNMFVMSYCVFYFILYVFHFLT